MPSHPRTNQAHSQPAKRRGSPTDALVEPKGAAPASAGISSDAGISGRILTMRVPAELRVQAAERLVSAPDRRRAAEALLAGAAQQGIDMSLLWGTISETPKGPIVRQVVMGVVGPGSTGMVFLSSPRPERRFGSEADQVAELGQAIRLTNEQLPLVAGKQVALCQALVDPSHGWADAACRAAGMNWVGNLQFLRRRWNPADEPHAFQAVHDWPTDVRLFNGVDPDHPAGRSVAMLERALEGSYEDTMDCPELCGLRPTRDVIASHRATGKFDPNRWWLLLIDGQPEGCCLLNHCPDSFSLELVYLGLSPRARGRGLGVRLLRHALAHADAPGVREITCAVDTRNTPALRLYHGLGFRAFAARTGFVQQTAMRTVELKPDAAQPAHNTRDASE